ncbi:RxLR-like protein [Plasmopara halstedii]|uniref:RxLR-like protein n=1 Tax=Plasmopara halstedii TaxID=4781 RepID=A0A0P1B2B5_PLAHL|nr:RxLR-like protein [Plasmopara halstedii]CEG47583.1 RxLR-like protein [Plasmopara halstedii]|eukprot:XP_024583952.1 RxLR-like protein [Plasmopara halstedii]
MRHQPFIVTLLITITLHASGIPSLGANLASSSAPLERPLSKLVGTVDKRHLKTEDAAESMDTEERIHFETETKAVEGLLGKTANANGKNVFHSVVTSIGADTEKVQAAVKSLDKNGHYTAPKDPTAT